MNMPRNASTQAAEETLDPQDWADVQAVSHQMIEDSIAYLRGVRGHPVWQEMPREVRSFFEDPLPRSASLLSEVYAQVTENVMPYPMATFIRASGPGIWARAMSPERSATFLRPSRAPISVAAIIPHP